MDSSEKLMIIKTRTCNKRHCKDNPHIKTYVGMKKDGSLFSLSIANSEVKKFKVKGSHRVPVLDFGDLHEIPRKYWPRMLEYDPDKPIKASFEEFFKRTLLPHMLPSSLCSTIPEEMPLDSQSGEVIDAAEDGDRHDGQRGRAKGRSQWNQSTG